MKLRSQHSIIFIAIAFIVVFVSHAAFAAGGQEEQTGARGEDYMNPAGVFPIVKDGTDIRLT